MRREAHYVKYYRGNSALDHAWCNKYLYAILQEEWAKLKKLVDVFKYKLEL